MQLGAITSTALKIIQRLKKQFTKLLYFRFLTYRVTFFKVLNRKSLFDNRPTNNQLASHNLWLLGHIFYDCS